VKLSRVEIKGFKSIAKKTALAIAGGVTCIAGPNGCGKSNIIDAVRWALGEQSSKALRASAMNEVIFSGTQEVGPGSLASVTLEFVKDGGSFPKSLEGFEEVSITRRLFRTGESEYLINNVKCRLKDITDLFLDTGLHRNGYAIIEQGKVKDIIQARPEEIRYLIEEAAEVGRFRLKRTEALRRLEATSRNLERINDLLGEVSKQRSDLKSQANKAKRYQELRAEANELARLVMASELQEIASLKQAFDAELEGIQGRMEGAQAQHLAIRNRLVAQEQLCSRLREETEGLARRMRDAEAAHLLAERELEAARARLGDIDAARDMLLQNLEEGKRAIRDEEALFGTRQEDLAQHQGEIACVLAELEGLQGEHERQLQAHEILERQYNEKRAALFEAIAEVRSLDQRIQEIGDRQKEAAANVRQRQQDLSDLAGSAEALARELSGMEAESHRIEQAREPLMQARREKAAAMEREQKAIEAGTGALIELEKDSAEAAAKLTMLARIVGVSQAQDALSAGSNGARKVSDTLSVKAGYEAAVGRSMGSALDFLIFRDHDQILSLKDFRTRGPGFVIEQPHVEAREQQPPSGNGSVHGRLSEFIEAREGYADIVRALSQDMYVVSDMEAAVSLWRQGHRTCSFVTIDGMILEPSGVIRTTHEHTKYAEVLKAKAEMKTLTARQKSIGEALARQRDDLARARERLQTLSGEYQAAGAAVQELDRELAGLSEKRQRAQGSKERVFERQRSVEADLVQMQELSERLAGLSASLVSQRAEREEMRSCREDELKAMDSLKEASKEGLAASQGRIQAVRDRLHGLQVKAAEVAAVLKAITEALGKRTQAMAKDQERMEELEGTRLAVEQALASHARGLDGARQDMEQLKASYEAAMPEYEQALALLRTVQEEARAAKDAMDQMERSRSELLLKGKEYEISHAMHRERMETRFGPGEPEIPADFDRARAVQKVAELEERIERMGQINFASLEAFDQAQKRWEDLHCQYEDIVRASTRLKEVISSIERQSIKAFTETFTRVRENFQEIFASMFGGGKADLVLAEGDEMEAGIEIFASPPFKKLKAMSLLSEGEKTLCAISFIFALFKVNPSPFCILDEVDAPLDDANIIRLNRLIRSFSKESQFLVVTHNRHTMEMADLLYGVTFDVPGVSKVVSMVLEDLQG
jgi:chromosome segregation protein